MRIRTDGNQTILTQKGRPTVVVRQIDQGGTLWWAALVLPNQPVCEHARATRAQAIQDAIRYLGALP